MRLKENFVRRGENILCPNNCICHLFGCMYKKESYCLNKTCNVKLTKLSICRSCRSFWTRERRERMSSLSKEWRELLALLYMKDWFGLFKSDSLQIRSFHHDFPFFMLTTKDRIALHLLALYIRGNRSFALIRWTIRTKNQRANSQPCK